MRRLLFILWRISKKDLRLAWFALKHPARPVWFIPALILLAIYAIAPFSYVLPLLGIVDDLVLVPLAFHFLLKLLPPQLRDNTPPKIFPMTGKRL
ncbi:MAG: hypothetical protein HYS18_10840 [Burkholderiales bacterium]|nr:hypothetical protein [Burkholderiales bacterium]